MYALTQSIKETDATQPGTVPRPQKPLHSSSIRQEPLRFSRVKWSKTDNPTDPTMPSDIYPIMHYFVTEMWTFLLQNGALWDMGLVHCGIYATGLLTPAYCWHGWVPPICHGNLCSKYNKDPKVFIVNARYARPFYILCTIPQQWTAQRIDWMVKFYGSAAHKALL